MSMMPRSMSPGGTHAVTVPVEPTSIPMPRLPLAARSPLSGGLTSLSWPDHEFERGPRQLAGGQQHGGGTVNVAFQVNGGWHTPSWAAAGPCRDHVQRADQPRQRRNLTLTAAAGGQSNFTGAITGSGGIAVSGAGVTVLNSSANSYSAAHSHQRRDPETCGRGDYASLQPDALAGRHRPQRHRRPAD